MFYSLATYHCHYTVCLVGLGWGIGLFATQDIHKNKIVRHLFAAFSEIVYFMDYFYSLCTAFTQEISEMYENNVFMELFTEKVSDLSSLTYSQIRNY